MTEYIKNEQLFAAYEKAPTGIEPFRTYKEFTRIGKDWQGKDIVELYNTLATTQGKSGVKKFTNRETGMQRLWSLIQELPVTRSAPSAEKRESKKDTVLRMIQESTGATLEEIMSATGWQAHSVRGFLSVQRSNYTIERIKRDDDLYAYYASRK